MEIMLEQPIIKETQIIEDTDKGKELSISRGYIVYKDGRCYSEKTKRFLTKRKNKGKTPEKFYYSYDISPYGNCLISRLVMFVHGKHKYKTIKEMPKIIHIDGDHENLHISNLKFSNQSEINKINNIKLPEWSYQNRGTIKKESKRIVEKLLEQKLTYKKIAEVFETSEMSVYRFVKKHIKGQNQNVKK